MEPEASLQRQARLLQGPPVAVLAGDEAPHLGAAGVRKWAIALFERQGCLAVNPDIGKVALTARCVRDSMSYGKPSQPRHCAFLAVKNAIENGEVVARAQHDRGMESCFISAPVQIGGIDNILTVLVRRDPNGQRMYVHSVDAKKNILNRKFPGTDTASGMERPGTSDSGFVDRISNQVALGRLSFSEVNDAIRKLLQMDIPGVAETAVFSRLRWRCRRGMRELDQLLERWLLQRWAAASDAERGVFLRLLDCEDDRLWAWFMGHDTPEDAELAALIPAISHLPP